MSARRQRQMCIRDSFYAAVEEDCTNGLVTEVFDDLGKVGADVILLHGCHEEV